MEREGKFDKLKLKEFKADEKIKDAKMQELAAKMNLDDTGAYYLPILYVHVIFVLNIQLHLNFNIISYQCLIGDWVDHGKTLREQGIMETEILLLKRKLFFNEVEETDNPIQRNVIYEQVGGKRRIELQFKLY